MSLIYVEPPANIAECIMCPNCSRTYPVPKDDEPRQTCGRCGCSMDTDKVGDFAEVNAKESAVALGMGVVAQVNRAVRGLVDLGFSEDEAREVIAKRPVDEAEDGKKAAKR